MSQGFKEVHQADVTAEIERHLIEFFNDILSAKTDGHCMRVADLDADLMRRLCSRLRSSHSDALIHVLATDEDAKKDALCISSTKLIELRNPDADGSQRDKLLVFVPNELRTSSEDSFGVATFEDIHVGEVYEALNTKLVAGLPVALRGPIQGIIQKLDDAKWTWANPVAVTKFLLTVKINENDADVVGGALNELGLVPDFKLMAEPSKAIHRVSRNLTCVQRLTYSDKSERLRIMDLGLAKPKYRADLANVLAEMGLANPLHWTRQIVRNSSNYPYSFDKWDFEDEIDAPDEVYIEVIDTSLPRVGEDNTDERLNNFLGQQVLPLGKNGLKKFGVQFEVDPAPKMLDGLSKFRLQVVSVSDGPTDLVKTAKAWTTATTKKTVNFTKLKANSLAEGWHFVRIQAFTEDGDRITLLDRNSQPLPWLDEDSSDTTHAPNESELFYVVPEGELDDVEPNQRAVQRYSSLIHAQTDLRFSAILDDRDADSVKLTDVLWSSRGRGQEMIEAKFGGLGSTHIPCSLKLRDIEQRMLAEPGNLCSWKIGINRGEVSDPIPQPIDEVGSVSLADLKIARAKLFEAISQGDKALLTQAADFDAIRDFVTDYASEYQSAIQYLLRKSEASSGREQSEARNAIESLLNLDAVELFVTDYRGSRQHAVLVGPLHPIRLLWWTGWTALCNDWLEKAVAARREFVSAARDTLLDRLLPNNQPPYLPVDHGRVYSAVDNVHPFWTLYAPNLERDVRGLIGNVCSALGLKEPAIGGMTVTGKYLAGRVQRYLVQHPYTHVLVINAFNPGRSSVLADMLLELQATSGLEDLKYDIRLFVPDANAPGVGEALIDLLNPDGSATAALADAFSSVSADHLNPKLRVSIRLTEDFRITPADYPSHISMLFDVFPAEEVSAAKFDVKESGAPVHGLLQDFVLHYIDDGETVAWKRQPRHGFATPMKGAAELSDLLSTLPSTFSTATATVATGQAGISSRPQVSLALSNSDRALIHQVHEVSDWAFTIDRNIGIEYFDHNDQISRPDYLIEHTPSLENGLGHQVLITSRSLVEIDAMMRSELTSRNLPADLERSAYILNCLRCLSGRLALKLISSPTQRTEALGLALAKMYLDHQCVFSNQVVVPLDAHLELYREPKRNAEDLGDEVSLKRTDLALLDLNAANRTIRFNLVEVKCYTSAGNLSEYNKLKDTVAEQLETSEKVIRLHFDPHLHSPDRIDRRFKSAEFGKMLEFYIERADRFGLLSNAATEEARFFVRTLDDGYRIEFTKSALIFDFEKIGTSPAEQDNDVEYHRIGIDVIRSMVEQAVPPNDIDGDEDTSMDDLGAGAQTPDTPPESPDAMSQSLEPASEFKLETAAFFVAERDHSVTWDSLTSRSISSLGIEDVDESKFRKSTSPDEVPSRDPPKLAAMNANDATDDVPECLEPRHLEVDSAVQPPVDISLSNDPAFSGEAGLQHQSTNDLAGPEYDVLLGANASSPQYGLLAEFAGRKIALDLNQTHTISLFGVQGGGKSYTLGTVAEMATVPIANINSLPSPLATVIFHYSPTQDYQPEFTSMQHPNSDETTVELLEERYGARPKAIEDVVLLAPEDKLDARRTEYPGIEVLPLKFSATELQVSHWQFLMGAVGNQAVYIRQLKSIMRKLRNSMSLDGLRAGIEESSMPDNLKDLASMRLDLAAQYIDDEAQLSSAIRPGRLVIVDLRDEFIEKDEALGLFVVLLQLFGDAKHEGQKFNKLIVFDEAHKYIDNPDLVAGLVEVVREMRHKGTSIMVASQDPPSVPVSLIELSTQIIMHRFNSPAWLKHIKKANAALNCLSPEKMAQLRQGEAFIWSSKATDESFSLDALKVTCRPRVTQHGGGTKTAT